MIGLNTAFLILCILFFNLLPIIIIFRIYRRFNFWRYLNVAGPKPNYFFGNIKKCVYGQCHFSELTKKFYDEFKNQKLIGIFIYNKPAVIIRDSQLIKDVLIKDFSTFSDRGIKVHDNVEPLAQHFFNLPEYTWRPLREKISPSLSVSKMKNKFEPIFKISTELIKSLEVESKNSECVETHKVVSASITRMVANFGFGLQINNIHDFQKMNCGRKSTLFNFIRRIIRQYFSVIYKYSGLLLKNSKLYNFYINFTKDIIDYRKLHNIRINDYFGIMMDLKENPQKINNIDLSCNIIAAQTYVFFTAGQDTTTILITYALFELANNSIIQNKLRDDLKSDDNITFDFLKKVKYLDLIYKETLRMYPLRDIIRASNREYRFSNTAVTIPKGTQIIIPHYAIHRDCDIYRDPENFDPERFYNCNFNLATYLPFGNGPRKCVGEKFAEIIFKLIITMVVKNFHLDICFDCPIKKNDPRNVFLYPIDGIKLKFKKI